MMLIVSLVAWSGCGGGDPTYAPCDTPDDCAVPEEAEAECLDKAGEGFCTWSCSSDADCAFDDDPDPDWTRVCASFESEPGSHCFPSCREGDEGDESDESDESDGDGSCPEGFSCRSTGGGSDNRKVCFPEDIDSDETPR
jgi:hypothetical protein